MWRVRQVHNSPCPSNSVGFPQQGQTPDGRLSAVAQTVYWQVDPATYGGSETFDITVTWQVLMALSQDLLWYGEYNQAIHPDQPPEGPINGYCNGLYCNCLMPFTQTLDPHTVTFLVPIPSSTGCPSG
jgi:hypothetical protein